MVCDYEASTPGYPVDVADRFRTSALRAGTAARSPCPGWIFAPAAFGNPSAFLSVDVHRNSRSVTVSPRDHVFRDFNVSAKRSSCPPACLSPRLCPAGDVHGARRRGRWATDCLPLAAGPLLRKIQPYQSRASPMSQHVKFTVHHNFADYMYSKAQHPCNQFSVSITVALL